MTAPRVSQEDRERAKEVAHAIEVWDVGGYEYRMDEESAADKIALALATVRAEERAACYDAVEAVAMRFRANHDPMSENAADECIAAIRAREGK